MDQENKTKLCQHCGVVLTRKRYGNRLEDRTVFEKRKFCSTSCANARTDKAKERKQEATKNQPRAKDKTFTAAQLKNLSPLDFLLGIMRDTSQPDDRRDRAAIAAAKYYHPRATAATGKKTQQQEAAKAAGSGRFASAPPPKVVPIR